MMNGAMVWWTFQKRKAKGIPESKNPLAINSAWTFSCDSSNDLG